VVAERSGTGPRKAARILDLRAVAEHVSSEHVDADEVDAVVARAEAQRALDRSRVDMMREYAETRRCRMEFLLGYFGDDDRRPCGRCDNCRSGIATEPAPEGPFGVGEHVRHEEFGSGMVTDVESDRVTVLFEDVGYRTLSLHVVEEHGLLSETP
jgi:ATP-dependent DNA helicase RecQ